MNAHIRDNYESLLEDIIRKSSCSQKQLVTILFLLIFSSIFIVFSSFLVLQSSLLLRHMLLGLVLALLLDSGNVS